MSIRDYFRIFIIHFCAIILVGACSSSDSGSEEETPPGNNVTATPTPTPEATATPTPTPAPTPTPPPTGTVGEFISVKDLAEADTKAFYGLGCKTPGADAGKKMIDPRLKVGDVFRDRTVIADPSNELVLELESKTQKVAKFESFFTSVVKKTNFPGVTVGQQSTNTCTVTSDDEGECQGSTSIQMQNAVYFYIFIPTQTTTTFQEGWYVLDKGSVRAWRKVALSSGVVLDPLGMTTLGFGKQTETSVYLLDIPSTGVDFCGGNSGVGETLIELNDGTRLNRFAGELLGADLE